MAKPSKTSVLQVRMDAKLKKEVEELYESMGTSFAEAVRMFAKKSVTIQGLPFELNIQPARKKISAGLAKGLYNIPDDIDICNDEIAEMFGVNE